MTKAPRVTRLEVRSPTGPDSREILVWLEGEEKPKSLPNTSDGCMILFNHLVRVADDQLPWRLNSPGPILPITIDPFAESDTPIRQEEILEGEPVLEALPVTAPMSDREAEELFDDPTRIEIPLGVEDDEARSEEEAVED